MNYVVYGLSLCAGGTCQPVQVQQAVPAQVVVVAQPRPILGNLFQPRPQVVVIQSAPNCAGGKCR